MEVHRTSSDPLAINLTKIQIFQPMSFLTCYLIAWLYSNSLMEGKDLLNIQRKTFPNLTAQGYAAFNIKQSKLFALFVARCVLAIIPKVGPRHKRMYVTRSLHRVENPLKTKIKIK